MNCLHKAYSGRAAAHHMKGEYEQAIQDYTASIQIYLATLQNNPKNIPVLLDCDREYRRRSLVYDAAMRTMKRTESDLSDGSRFDLVAEDIKRAGELEKRALEYEAEGVPTERTGGRRRVMEQIAAIHKEIDELRRSRPIAQGVLRPNPIGGAILETQPSYHLWLVNTTKERVRVYLSAPQGQNVTMLEPNEEHKIALWTAAFTYRLGWENEPPGPWRESQLSADRPRTLFIRQPGTSNSAH